MVWLLENVDALDPTAVLARLPALSEARAARVRTMKNEGAQVRAVLAELLLRRALREELGRTELPRIAAGEYGKPYFPDCPRMQFNLSHCRTAVACALDAAPVGVDVEAIRPWRPALARVLTPDERAWVEVEDSDCRFTALWTAKEALGKARGVGLGYELAGLDCRNLSGALGEYQLTHWSGPNWELSLCSQAALPLRIEDAHRILLEVSI